VLSPRARRKILGVHSRLNSVHSLCLQSTCEAALSPTIEGQRGVCCSRGAVRSWRGYGLEGLPPHFWPWLREQQQRTAKAAQRAPWATLREQRWWHDVTSMTLGWGSSRGSGGGSRLCNKVGAVGFLLCSSGPCFCRGAPWRGTARAGCYASCRGVLYSGLRLPFSRSGVAQRIVPRCLFAARQNAPKWRRRVCLLVSAARLREGGWRQGCSQPGGTQQLEPSLSSGSSL
jgi:hypothetical protein